MDLLFDLLKTALIGFVQGVTEWLPVSSTGHMILLNEFVKLNVSEEFWNVFLVVVQIGAILAVCVLYFTRLNPFSRAKSPAERKNTWVIWAKIILGVIPPVIVGLLFDEFVEEHFYNSWVVAVALIVYGVAFIVIEVWRGRKIKTANAGSVPAGGAHFAQGAAGESDPAVADPGIQTIDELSFGKALGIGFFQILALMPGTSRSGSTIIGGLLLGASRSLATEFSFFMAIPIMFGASGLRLVKYFLAGNGFSGAELAILGVGMFVAFVVSVFTIKLMRRFVKTNDFKPFGIYRIVLGVVVIAYFLLK